MNDMDIATVGVVGAGVMGSEVAMVVAQAGFAVVLVDITVQALDKARSNIRQSQRFQQMMASTRDRSARPIPRAADVLRRISFSTDISDLAGADVVVENVTEDWAVKRAVYPALDSLTRPDVVFAVNTSVIPITKVAGATNRPDKVIGVHFMNPVSVKPMVEVIRGYHTSEQTVKETLKFLARLGKEAMVIVDSPGFVSNRVLMLTINEAAYLVHEGVADAADVDGIFKGCFGHAMGPLETADLIGVDTILRSIEGLQEAFGDSKYRPCPLLRRMVDAGLHGRKNGQGFYRYDEV